MKKQEIKAIYAYTQDFFYRAIRASLWDVDWCKFATIGKIKFENHFEHKKKTQK